MFEKGKETGGRLEREDQASSLFWLGLAVYVCMESLRLGVGTLRNPGMGLMAFGGGILLGLFSLALFIQATIAKNRSPSSPAHTPILWKRVVLVLMALWIYAKVMPLAGYLITTFLLMGFLFWIVKRQKIGWVLLSAFLTTLISYLVFSKWLNCQFPQGLFGF